MSRALAAIALTLASAAAGQEITADEARANRLAIDRGELLYAYDRAAWLATDALTAEVRARGISDTLMSVGAGYVIEGDRSEQTVTFYDRKTPPRTLFQAKAVGRDGKLVSSGLTVFEQILTPAQQRLAQMRGALLQQAAKERISLCAQANPNFTVLPPIGASRNWLGYVMTPQTAVNAWPVGGHYRHVFTDGVPGQSKPTAKSCLSVGPQPGDKSSPAAMVVSHILDDTPTEIHVFTALASRRPVYVLMARTRKLWSVEPVDGQARIRLVDAGVGSSRK